MYFLILFALLESPSKKMPNLQMEFLKNVEKSHLQMGHFLIVQKAAPIQDFKNTFQSLILLLMILIF